jgi:HEAT repeat protein
MKNYSRFVDQLAFASERNRAIIGLVGAINATDLRRAQVDPLAKAALIGGLDHPNAKVRWWCLQLMDHLADESYLEPILSKLTDPVAKVRRHVIHALTCGACKPDRHTLDLDIAETLKAVLDSDPDAKVREEAREGLLRLACRSRSPHGG